VTLQPPEDESAAPPLFEILLNAQKLSTFWVCMPSGTSAKEEASLLADFFEICKTLKVRKKKR